MNPGEEIPPADPHAWWCQQVVEGVADAIIAADLGGVIRLWNTSAAALLGHPKEAAIGARLDLIIPGMHQGAHRAGFAEAMRAGRRRAGVPDVLFPALHQDGTTVQVRGTLTILKDPATGTSIGAAVIVRKDGGTEG